MATDPKAQPGLPPVVTVDERKVAEIAAWYDAMPAEDRAVLEALGELDGEFGDDFEAADRAVGQRGR